MRSLARLSIERPLYPWLLAALCLFGGIWGIGEVGRLEDPPFPIKNAFVITPYPGASALEVEQEVTDVLERALQQLPELDILTSKSLAGRSEVQVQLLEEYGSDDTPQIWDELRRRVREALPYLPPGTLPPIIQDDFGDVYGMVYAVRTPGYSASVQRDLAKQLERELKRVAGVAKVRVEGLLEEAIYVELSQERLQRLGVPVDSIFNALATENQVQSAGSVMIGDRRMRVAPEPALNSVAAVGEMRIGQSGSTQIVRLRDIATIAREEVEIPREIIRHDGERVMMLSVSVTETENVVAVGEAVDAVLDRLAPTLPLGVELAPVTRQHVLVANAVRDFLRNLLISVATVIGALCLFMGWRAGAVVGSVLLLTVLGTLLCMALFGVELQRISLGALMIAMGMLVDNAIVVAEGMVTGVRSGRSPAEAAEHAVRRTQIPLLGATLIGIMAFAPIGLSDDDSGHFLRSLFDVVAISLLLSWVLAITLVPMLGHRLLKPVIEAQEQYSGWAYAPYRGLLQVGLRFRWLSVLAILAVTAGCFWGFTKVRQEFFPTSNSPLFFVDYYLPQGTDITTTAAVVADIEAALTALPEVTAATSFIGRGTPRFAATIRPEQPNPAYAHMILRVRDVREMDDVMARATPLIQAVHPDAELIVSRSEFSPGGASKVEARFSGPNADTLRELSEAALREFIDFGLVDIKTDWRARELQLVPRYNEERGRAAGIYRSDLYNGIAFATLGVRVGLFRDGDDLLPIIARAPQRERRDLVSLGQRRLWSPTERAYVPSDQVLDGVELVGVDSLILRRQRERTITVQANPPPGANFIATFERLRPRIDALPLPPGYALEWGGEFEANLEARESLGGVIPATFGVMLILTMLLFGAVRQTLVIWLTVPMTVCGVVLALLITDLGFTFPAFLGVLSLTGMLIKNAVVLVDEIDKRAAEQGLTIDTIADASVSRMRPVLLASGTTIAGMSPLLNDPFFKEMAVCIMGGLAFSTLLTLIAVPVFYRVLIRSRRDAADMPQPPAAALAAGDP
ncbi:MAG: efflux RND transporter permease subunit [Pseudomonadota bacterium]